MADYKKNTRAGGSYGRAFTRNTQGPKELFDAECNSCHNRCQVPFRPNGKKPVYCANCFTKNDTRGDTRGDMRSASTFHSDSRARPQRNFASEASDRQMQDLKREIQAMNATLKDLVTAVDTFNRATALTLEIQKHFPIEKAPVAKKKAAVKKSPAKTVAKKTAKK